VSEFVYDRLIDTLVRLHGAIPIHKCAEFTALIEELFTPDEAELAAALPPGMQPLEVISKHVNRPVESIKPLLESMANKGLVLHRLRDDHPEYKLMAVLPGFFEFQFMKGGKTEHDRKMARLFKNYFDKLAERTKGAPPELLKKLTPFSRVIPVEKEVAGGSQIQPYEIVSQYIRNADSISVSTCYCRHFAELLGDPCHKPKRNCMAFGPNAKFIHERGYGQLVSKEEALKILDEAEKAGLVHMSSNTAKYIDFICNCCACHCGILKSFQTSDVSPLGAVSSFRLKINQEACTGCGDCLARCPTKALAINDAVVRLDARRCIGCGLCSSACPSEALSMERRENPPTPPWDHQALAAAMMESIQRAKDC